MAFLHPNTEVNDDLEAGSNAARQRRKSSVVTANGKGKLDDLGEYSNLDRYISTYREGGNRLDDEDDKKRSKKKWWQFWKGSTDQPQQPPAEVKNITPDTWLETDLHNGLSQSDVEERRKSVGYNELVAETENMFAKFLGFFTGPILYGEYIAVQALD